MGPITFRPASIGRVSRSHRGPYVHEYTLTNTLRKALVRNTVQGVCGEAASPQNIINEREKKFHRRSLREPIQRPFNVSSIFLLQNKSISVFLSEKLIHFLSFFFFYSSRNSDLDPSRYCLHDGEKERVILTEVAGL